MLHRFGYGKVPKMAQNESFGEEGSETPLEELSYFLENLKLIYEHGVAHSRSRSRLHLLFAIHNCHYVVEQILRERARDMTFSDSLRKIGLKEIIKRVHDKKNIPDYNRLLNLNTIRNNAEHSDIIPDADTVRFYVRITEEFLRWSFSDYFNVDYDLLKLEDRIHDVPIRNVMLEAKQRIKEKDLPNASRKMYEALGAFKFMWFAYLSDSRVHGITFSPGIDFPNLLADLAFKIILAEDESTLLKLLSIGSRFETKNGEIVGVKSIYPVPTLRSEEEANEHYSEILSIILTYQDKVPVSRWRSS